MIKRTSQYGKGEGNDKTLASEGAKEWWTAVDVDTVGGFIVASQSETKAVPDLK